MIGFYPLSTGPAVPLPPANLTALFSSLSLTVSTSLPNFLVPTPSFTTPAYAFNTSVPTSAIVGTDLAAATYTPLLSNVNDGAAGGEKFNFSALPQVAPSPTLATLILTDASGVVYTTTSVAPTHSVVLGEPPGFSSAGARATPGALVGCAVALAMCLLSGFGAVY